MLYSKEPQPWIDAEYKYVEEESPALTKPAAFTPKVDRHYDTRMEHELERHTPSAAREAAINTHQANLDIHRGLETIRIEETLMDASLHSIARMDKRCQAFNGKHPHLDAHSTAMQIRHNNMLEQLPTASAMAYYNRYHKTRGSGG